MIVTTSSEVAVVTAVATPKMTIVEGDDAMTPPTLPPILSMNTVAATDAEPAAMALTIDVMMTRSCIDKYSCSGCSAYDFALLSTPQEMNANEQFCTCTKSPCVSISNRVECFTSKASSKQQAKLTMAFSYVGRVRGSCPAAPRLFRCCSMLRLSVVINACDEAPHALSLLSLLRLLRPD